MRLAILSRGRSLYSTRRLVQTGRQRGHHVAVIDPLQCITSVGPHGIEVTHEGHSLRSFDCVIPRIGSTTADAIINLLQNLAALDVYILNGSEAIRQSRDKFRSLQALAIAGLPIPQTTNAHSGEDILKLLPAIGPPPYIFKLREGTQGVGVMKPDSLDAAKSVLHTLLHLEKSVLIQEYIAASHGMDVRVFVVNGRVIGSMQRTATNGEFRSNLHLGGRGSRYSLTPEMREISIAAAHTFDLHIAGVDLLLSDDGPLITEVNPSPGLEGIESITGLDIARSIVRAAENLTREHQIARASH